MTLDTAAARAGNRIGRMTVERDKRERSLVSRLDDVVLDPAVLEVVPHKAFDVPMLRVADCHNPELPSRGFMALTFDVLTRPATRKDDG
jgi:hypothetical protein